MPTAPQHVSGLVFGLIVIALGLFADVLNLIWSLAGLKGKAPSTVLLVPFVMYLLAALLIDAAGYKGWILTILGWGGGVHIVSAVAVQALIRLLKR